MKRIPITKPEFDASDREAVLKPLDSGWVVQGPFVRQFEEQFSAFTGAACSVAASSCTTALHLAVRCLDLKPGDEVIVPALTWISTANVIEYAGARPIFCDIDLDTFNLDANLLEALVTPRTVGVIPVHLFGLCANMDAILPVARRHGLWVVEDAACGLGARQRGRHAGTFGEAGCFSFHPRKSITTGEGGMLTTPSREVDRLARSLRDHGGAVSDLERHESGGAPLLGAFEHLGYNYRMTDIQAALGCSQLARAERMLKARAARAHVYDAALADVSWLRTPAVPEGDVHGYQAYVCLFRPDTPTPANVGELHARRNAVMQRLDARGISTRQGTHAPVLLAYYAKKYDLRPDRFPNACLADRLSLALPLYSAMTEADQDYVCSAIRDMDPTHA